MRELVKIRHYFFYFSAFVIIIGGLKMASQAVIIIFLSIFISSVLSPVLDKLQKYKVPKFLAYMILVLMVLVIIFFIAFIISGSLKSFINNIPIYEIMLKNLIADSLVFLNSHGFSIETKSIIESINFGALFNFTATTAGSIGMFFSKMLLVFIGVAFILAESTNLEKKIDIIFKKNKSAKRHFKLFSDNIHKYFTIKTLTSLLTGIFITFTLIMFDIDYPILWGFLGFLLNFIPVIGSIIASIPALLLGLMHHDFATVAWLALAYLVINISISNIIEPKYMGQGLGLSAMIIFFSLIFWGWVLGPAGMFLAVPLTMTLKIAFDSNPNTEWIGILFSNLAKRDKG